MKKVFFISLSIISEIAIIITSILIAKILSQDLRNFLRQGLSFLITDQGYFLIWLLGILAIVIVLKVLVELKLK